MLACDLSENLRVAHLTLVEGNLRRSLLSPQVQVIHHHTSYVPCPCHQDRNGSSSMLNLYGQIIALHSVKFAILGWAKKLQNFSLSVSYSIINLEQVPLRFRLPLSGENNPR
jgi:hypothetical protein